MIGGVVQVDSAVRLHVAAANGLTNLVDRFERLQTVRWALNPAALCAAIWALLATVTAA
jgi:hypothetical protein